MSPILRWAGGKSGLMSAITAHVPTGWNRYVEPMLGGGALFFELEPRRALLADVNAELIAFYTALKTMPEELIARLGRLRPSKSMYYRMRGGQPRAIIDKAVRFAYLNRLAWNGLYRVNQQGQFNVPIGDRLPAKMWDIEALHLASSVLQRAHVLANDFREVIGHIKRGDFVFFDPPYPKGSRERTGFNRYSSAVFKDSDHAELAAIVEMLSSRSIPVMVTIGDVDHLNKLYPRRLRRIRVRSSARIACNGRARREVGEIILTNY